MKITSKATVMIMVLTLSIVSIFSPLVVAPDPDGWDYFKVLTIANANNNYQMFINVTKTSGGDVNCSGHCEDDFDDIRFYDVDEVTELAYWREKYVSGEYALYWVNLSSDVETDNAIRIYYGNSSVPYTGNGSNVFYYFDNWTVDNTGDWYTRFETEPGGNDTFHANIDVSGVASWEKVRLRYRMNRTSYLPANPHAGLRFGVADNDSWDATDQYPDNAVYWSDFYDAGCSDSTHNFYRIGVRDAGGYTGGDDICLAFTPDDYRVWDLQVNGSAYTGLLKVYDDGYNLLETAVVTTTGAAWPDTSLFDGILLGVYIDDGVHYWSHDATAGDGALRIGGERDGAPEDYNIALIDWMFLSKYLAVEPSISSVGDENTEVNAAPVISNVYPTNNSYGAAGFTPTLHIDVDDAEGDTINITWQWYNDSGWHTFGTNLTETCNLTYYQLFNNATEYHRNYTWRVLINDSYGNWINRTYEFVAEIIFIKDPNNPVLASGGSTLCLSPDIVYDAEDDEWHLFYTRSVGGNRDIYRCDLTDVNQSSISYPGTAVLTATYTYWICSILKYIENNTAVFEDEKYWMYFADAGGGRTNDIYYATATDVGGTWTVNPTAIIYNTGQAWHNTYLGRLGLCAKKDTDGNYILMYDGQDSDTEDSLGYATSTTKTSWTEYAGNPVMTPGHTATGGEPPDQPWDDDWYAYPYLFKRPGNDNYYIIYNGQFYNTTGTDWGAERLGYANSTDMNTWTTYDWNPIFNESHPEYSEIWDNNDTSDTTLAISANGTTTYLFYEGEESEVTNYYSIGRAWSNNFDDVFTTGIANNAPIVESPNPVDAATGVSVSLSQISVWINDTEGDGINWMIETSPNIGSQDNSTAEEGNGSKVCTVSGLQGHTTYTWYVNVTDNGGGGWNNKIYTFTTELITFDIDVDPDTWLTGNVDVGTNIQENFTFWQNGSATIDITINFNYTNYTFVTYVSWLNFGHDQYCANFTTNDWASESSIEPGYPPTSVLKSSFSPGSFNFGIRIWMPRTVTYSDKQEDFEIVLVVSEST